eukprot:TRINITY_DN22829_c0_g1_i1.p1 TRINITY_DN22829_c0_g1~~TRINITY_DN22829_c0_g1_i1.p1  ORF type:complete len:432 (-),score=118.29 TRINITY_DN22829_c0_g1_i1:491-1786(-)
MHTSATFLFALMLSFADCKGDTTRRRSVESPPGTAELNCDRGSFAIRGRSNNATVFCISNTSGTCRSLGFVAPGSLVAASANVTDVATRRLSAGSVATSTAHVGDDVELSGQSLLGLLASQEARAQQLRDEVERMAALILNQTALLDQAKHRCTGTSVGTASAGTTSTATTSTGTTRPATSSPGTTSTGTSSSGTTSTATSSIGTTRAGSSSTGTTSTGTTSSVTSNTGTSSTGTSSAGTSSTGTSSTGTTSTGTSSTGTTAAATTAPATTDAATSAQRTSALGATAAFSTTAAPPKLTYWGNNCIVAPMIPNLAIGQSAEISWLPNNCETRAMCSFMPNNNNRFYYASVAGSGQSLQLVSVTNNAVVYRAKLCTQSGQQVSACASSSLTIGGLYQFRPDTDNILMFVCPCINTCSTCYDAQFTALFMRLP